ncbi:chemotaxis protein [Vibrio sp. ZSDE26]|uniref:Chemotaxis protein n=1 Tax=Vibrio amylolyticus TaxID=2847292 RepID=A0A9X1XHV8_9VIBR|nr:chemotaxis protein [Vibrio amylolyticus]MCK6262113.1 chemotaxis protein [Vibrio amylolyticus]
MTNYWIRWVALFCVFTLSGCSLLEVKIDSQTTPLTKQELNMRLMTREFAQQFFAQVEQTADMMALSYSEDDTFNQSHLLLWKINASEGLQGAAYQVAPMAGLIDTWVFSYQMTKFFESGAGQALFAQDDALMASKQLSMEMDQLAKGVLKGSAFQSTQAFVVQFAQENPFSDISFTRTPAYRKWLESNDINGDEAVATLGTMPEALGDVSDKLSLVSEQTPKVMTWKAQLLALNSSLSGAELTATLQSIQESSQSFQDFVENNPEYMRNLAEQMAIELQPLVDDIDTKTNDKLSQLSIERQALEKMVEKERIELISMIERERKAIAVIVSNERERFTQDIDQMSQDIVTLAIEKLIELIKSVLLYFVLFILTIFFAPLGLGYYLGKRASTKA